MKTKTYYLILSIPLLPMAGQTQTGADVPAGQPEAVVDLATADGVNLVEGQWRYSDVKIIEVDFKGHFLTGQAGMAP